MKIHIAENSGFCFGVRRAVNIAKSLLKKKGKLYTMGHIIHNKRVIDDLKKMGLKNVNSLGEVGDGCFLIRSHGIEKQIFDELIKRGIIFRDATCPFVKRIENLIIKHKADDIILFGDKNHPEVLGLVSFAGKSIRVVEKYSDLKKIKSKLTSPVLISQTTKSIEEFKKIKEALMKLYPGLQVYDTICSETESRQNEAKEIAGRYDCIFVIGGRNSANTRRLFEISKKIRKRTYFIEDIDKDVPAVFQKNPPESCAILSGASTPDYLVRSLKNNLLKRYYKNG